MIPGLSHIQFADGINPPCMIYLLILVVVKKQDLIPGISAEEAHREIASIVSDFLVSTLPTAFSAKNGRSCEQYANIPRSNDKGVSARIRYTPFSDLQFRFAASTLSHLSFLAAREGTIHPV